MKHAIALFALATCISTAALAEDFTHEAAKVKFSTPAGWKAEHEGDHLSVASSDEAVALEFMVVDAKDLQGALDALDKAVEENVDDFKAEGDAEDITINGMEGKVADGKGKVEGKAVDVSALLLKTKAGKFLMVFGIADSAKLAKHAKDVENVLKSIKPM